LIVFHYQGAGREKVQNPMATVAKDGSFELTTYAHADGAPEGEYGITIVWRQKGKEAKMSLSGEGGGGTVDMLDGRYGDVTSPKLKKTVKKGEPNEFRFDLE
jgi:hypothetical protein